MKERSNSSFSRENGKKALRNLVTKNNKRAGGIDQNKSDFQIRIMEKKIAYSKNWTWAPDWILGEKNDKKKKNEKYQ